MYKIWDKVESINGVEANIVIKSHKIKEDDEVFLVLNKYNKVIEVNIVDVIKYNYNLNYNLSAEETAQEYIKIKEEEKLQADKEQISLEEQAKKISILQEQNANLLLDNAKKEIEINGLNKNLANVTLEIAKIKGGM